MRDPVPGGGDFERREGYDGPDRRRLVDLVRVERGEPERRSRYRRPAAPRSGESESSDGK